jgi:Predicted sulfurtransferase
VAHLTGEPLTGSLTHIPLHPSRYTPNPKPATNFSYLRGVYKFLTARHAVAKIYQYGFLHNRISNKELKERLYQETEPRTTISFYRYFPIADPRQFRDEFYLRLSELHVFGRIYVAHEGINAQASVPQSKFEALREYLYSIPELNGMRINIAVDDNGKSFWVLKVKVRPKIVADGIDDPDFDMSRRGRYVNAEQMNEMLKDPNTIVVDMRNHYEYEVGHFVRAVEVPSDTFREQLPMAVDMLKDKKDANIIMYCTGGIRCEKASAYMLHKGFKNVFHLEGGIINYARQIKKRTGKQIHR